MWGIQFPFSLDIPQQFERERPSIGLSIRVEGCDVGGGGAVRQTHIHRSQIELRHVVVQVFHVDVQGGRACRRWVTCPK